MHTDFSAVKIGSILVFLSAGRPRSRRRRLMSPKFSQIRRLNPGIFLILSKKQMRVKQMLHSALTVVAPLVDESDIERMTREGGNHTKMRPDRRRVC